MPKNGKQFAVLADFLVEVAATGNPTHYATYRRASKRKYRPQAGTVTPQVALAHLKGTQPIGVYLVRSDVTSAAIIDFDDHDGALEWDDMVSKAIPIIDKLRETGLPLLLCRSGGGAGLHAWMFWEEPQSAKLLKEFLTSVIASAGFKNGTGGVEDNQVEIFPKNEVVKEGNKGNLIALPYARDSVPLDDTLQPIAWEDFETPVLADLYSPNVNELYQPPPPKDQAKAKQKPQKVKTVFSGDVLPGDEEQVREALKKLDPNDYDQWFRFGMAIKYSLGAGAFSVWDDWASQSAKYDGQEKSRATWDWFDPDGTLTIGTIFHHAREAGWDGPSNPVIREYNAKYGIYTYANTSRIILKDTAEDEVFAFLSRQAFLDRLAADKYSYENAAGNPVTVPRAKIWLSHPLANHYYKTVFDPSLPPGHNGHTWNIWKGFAVKPAEGDWSKLLDHIRDNICSGNSDYSEWLLNWLALGVQQPAYVIGTAPVLIGLPGTGKGVLANAYGRLWRPHFVSITKDDHVSGKFNQHLEGRRFVYVDEAMFGGDRRNAGVIKTMLTEPKIMIERKGVDPIAYDNHMIFMATSNERSVVPADIGDRRWQVFQVSPDRREDKAYFSALMQQMENGGYEAMLHDLLRRDISNGPNPRAIIKTPELFEQIIQAQGPIEKYIYQILDAGYLPQPDAPGNGLGVTTIAAMYSELRRTQPAQYIQRTIFGRELRKIIPTIQTTQSGKFVDGYLRSGEPKIERSTRYQFPPLEACRDYFELHIGQDIPWSDTTTEWLGDVDPAPDFGDLKWDGNEPF